MKKEKKSSKQIAKEIRKVIIKMHQRGPHVASALSVVDILSVLYFDILKINSFKDPDRDRFILSKGHAVSALYATLMKKGFLDKSLPEKYIIKGSDFYGHPVRGAVTGIEASTGSLGHGLSIGIGMALAAKKDNRKYRVFVLMGDGECQEGSVWEGAIQASRLKLDNITVIIDANKLQGYDRVENIQPVSALKDKWEAFGWGATEVDGHSTVELKKVLKRVPFIVNKPSLIIAHTIKGKGVPEMEGQLGWHYFSVPKEKVELFIKGL